MTERTNNPHYFLGEELFVPNVDKNDGGRINMVTNHFNQFLTLENAERPRVFTRFENQIGKYSTAIKKYNEPIQVLKIFSLNENNFFIVVELLESGKYDLINYTSVINLTENYGYLSDFMVDLKENEIIPADTIIYKNRMYDDEGNLQIGTNLKCVFLPKGGLTYEDGIYITEEAAEKLSHTEVSEITVMLNSNDVLINYYGDLKNYKPYPSIGETIKNGILCARRRINYNFVLDEFKAANFCEINNNDQCFFVEGIVEDIVIYSNLSEEEKLYKYNSYIKELNDENIELYTSINNYLSNLKIQYPDSFSDNLNWLLQYSIDYIQPKRVFSFDNTEFNGTIIKFKIKNSVKAKTGSKITGRFGNKGVVSGIIPKTEMPISEDGTFIPDICLNGLGVIGRLNLAQLYEMELTYYSDCIIKKFKNNKKVLYENLIEFLSITSPELSNFLTEKLKNKKLKDEFLDTVINEGLYIHQPPFYDNITIDKMLELIKRFDIELLKFKNIESKLVAGTMYFIKLKHEPYGKLSIRSAGPISLLNIPYKNNESIKKNTSLYSNAAIRFGEMETINMMLTEDPKGVGNFIKTYSSSEEARQYMIKMLMNKDIDNIDSVVDENLVNESNTSETFRALLAGTGMSFVKKE